MSGHHYLMKVYVYVQLTHFNKLTCILLSKTKPLFVITFIDNMFNLGKTNRVLCCQHIA